MLRIEDASYSFEKKTDSITHNEMQSVAKGIEILRQFQLVIVSKALM